MKLKQQLLTGSWLVAVLFFFGCENTEPTGAGSSIESELNALALSRSPCRVNKSTSLKRFFPVSSFHAATAGRCKT